MKKYLVLVVEDETALARLLKAHLEAHGMSAVLAHSTEEALKLLKDLDLDLVLLDMTLPDGSGYKILRQLRRKKSARSKTPRLPVIVQSARGLPTEVLCETEGISAFLRKPYRTSEMLKAVRAALKEAA